MRKIQMSLNASQLVLCMWKVARPTSASVVRLLVASIRMAVGPGALSLFGSESMRIGALQSLCDLAKSLLGSAPRKSTDADATHGSVDQEVALFMLELGALDVLFMALNAVDRDSPRVRRPAPVPLARRHHRQHQHHCQHYLLLCIVSHVPPPPLPTTTTPAAVSCLSRRACGAQ